MSNENNKVSKTKLGTAKISDKGYYVITSYKEGNNMKMLHRLVWEDHYGRPIPDGYDIHHINGDKLDNRIQNLQCVSRSAHRSFHARHMSDETRRKMSEAKKGENHPMYGKISPNKKSYARIVKDGFNKGRQRYGIKKDGKVIKHSWYSYKLVEWFKENYPKEILVLHEGE